MKRASEDQQLHETALSRRDFQIGLLITVGFVIAVWSVYFVATACGSFHDDAIYVSTAQSLAAGSGYRLINVPGSPPQTKYPILYPLMLSAIWKISPDFPGNLVLMQAATLACAAGALLLSYLYLIRFGYASRHVAMTASLLAATTPYFAFVSTRVLSEMPFALLTILALWRSEVALRRTSATWRFHFVTGAVLALPYLCRSVGVVVPIAAVTTLLFKRKPVVATMAGACCAAAPWVIWSLSALGNWQRDNISGYYTDYVGSWAVLLTHPAQIIVGNLLFLNIDTNGMSIGGLRQLLYSGLAWRLEPLLILTGVATWWSTLRRAYRLELLPVFLVVYATLLVAWPWPPSRFLLPILPLVLSQTGRMSSAIVRRLLPTFHRTALTVIVAVALLANVTELASFGWMVRTTSFPYPVRTSRPVTWDSYEQLFSWLRANTETADRIGAPLDSMIFLYAQRQAFRPFRHLPERIFYSVSGPDAGSPEELIDALSKNNARYLALFPIPGFEAERAMFETVAASHQKFPGRLKRVYLGRDPRFIVFEVK